MLFRVSHNIWFIKILSHFLQKWEMCYLLIAQKHSLEDKTYRYQRIIYINWMDYFVNSNLKILKPLRSFF